MQESNNYKKVKDFLSYNNIEYNLGYAIENFNIKYYVDNELRYQSAEQVHFTVQHPEFTDDIKVSSLNCELYYCGFRASCQIYEFNKEENVFVILSRDSNNKHGKNYKVEIKR